MAVCSKLDCPSTVLTEAFHELRPGTNGENNCLVVFIAATICFENYCLNTTHVSFLL